MRKFFVLAAAALLLGGCDENGNLDSEVKARRFEFEGHSYIEFYRHNLGYDNITGYVHDPDCWCLVDDGIEYD